MCRNVVREEKRWHRNPVALFHVELCSMHLPHRQVRPAAESSLVYAPNVSFNLQFSKALFDGTVIQVSPLRNLLERSFHSFVLTMPGTVVQREVDIGGVAQPELVQYVVENDRRHRRPVPCRNANTSY